MRLSALSKRRLSTPGLLFFMFFLASPSRGEDWQEEKSSHFQVYYKQAPRSFVKSVSKAAEDIYRQTAVALGITRYKGWIGGARVKIYIFNDAEEYSAATKMGWSGGSVVVQERKIRTYPRAHGFFDSLLPHEIGHIIFRDFVGYNVKIPFWLEEGVASYQEQAGGVGADSTVRKAIRVDNFISLKTLSSFQAGAHPDKDRVNLAYAESTSVVAFMIEKYEIYRFLRLCRELREGRRFEWALNKAYMKFKTVSDLEKAWRKGLANGEDE